MLIFKCRVQSPYFLFFREMRSREKVSCRIIPHRAYCVLSEVSNAYYVPSFIRMFEPRQLDLIAKFIRKAFQGINNVIT